MARIQDIPFELLALILKNVYLASRALRHPEYYETDSESEDKAINLGTGTSAGHDRRSPPAANAGSCPQLFSALLADPPLSYHTCHAPQERGAAVLAAVISLPRFYHVPPRYATLPTQLGCSTTSYP